MRKGRTHLTVGANLLDDLADLGLETHVEHAISLVHDEVGNAAKVGLAGLEHVDETSGGGDDDLGSTLEVADLSSLGNSSVDAGVANARRRAELGALLLDLNGELTGGSDDEGDGSVSGGEEGLGVDVDLRSSEVSEIRGKARAARKDEPWRGGQRKWSFRIQWRRRRRDHVRREPWATTGTEWGKGWRSRPS